MSRVRRILLLMSSLPLGCSTPMPAAAAPPRVGREPAPILLQLDGQHPVNLGPPPQQRVFKGLVDLSSIKGSVGLSCHFQFPTDAVDPSMYLNLFVEGLNEARSGARCSSPQQLKSKQTITCRISRAGIYQIYAAPSVADVRLTFSVTCDSPLTLAQAKPSAPVKSAANRSTGDKPPSPSAPDRAPAPKAPLLPTLEMQLGGVLQPSAGGSSRVVQLEPCNGQNQQELKSRFSPQKKGWLAVPEKGVRHPFSVQSPDTCRLLVDAKAGHALELLEDGAAVRLSL